MSRARHRRSSDRGALRVLLVVIILFAVVGGGAGGLYLWATGASGPTRPVTVEIPEGATAADVADLLEDVGVVRSALAFRVLARGQEAGGSILPGTYSFRTNMRPQEALDVLLGGPALEETVTVTIPEGYRVDQTAERLAETFGFDADEFEAAATGGEYALPPYLPEGTETVEGFLFPKTYELLPASDPDALIWRLLQQFESEVADLRWGRAERLGLSPYEIVIVASLIEREARVDKDRRKISSVIYNRLERGMRLQIDATVIYGMPEHKTRLTYEDYEFESPYNTYLVDGLPPTPIASPGLASLQAALNPANTDFLFYLVVDPETGRHGFTETYEEFLRLKNEVQRGG